MITAINELETLAAPWIVALVNSMWQSCLITAAVAATLRLAKSLNASTRYAIWWVTLAGTIALFVVNLSFIAVRDSVPSRPIVAAVEPDPQPPAASVVSHYVAVRREPLAATAPAPRAIDPRPTRSPLQIHPYRLPLIIAFAWSAAALFMLARVALGIGLIVRIRSNAGPAPLTDAGRLRELIRTGGIRRSVALKTSADLRTPIAAGLYRPAILMPTSLIPQLTATEFDQVAMHELAHIQRWDDWANLVQRVVIALFVFHPAIRFISRQLDLEREIACDDFVLEQTGKAREYAACLTRIVELTGWAHQPSLAPGAAINKSNLVRRVELLLDGRRDSRRFIARGAVLAVGIVLVLMVLSSAAVPALWAFSNDTQEIVIHTPSMAPVTPQIALPSIRASVPTLPTPRIAMPALLAQAVAAAGGEQTYTSYESGHDVKHVRVRWTRDSRTFEMDMQGDVVFTDDDRDVRSLAPSGWFRMSEQGSSDRRYEVRSDDAGGLARTYFEGGRPMAITEDGRQWLALRLPEMIRETGVGAEKRVQRMLLQGGPDAVVSEIGLIHSDGSKRLYLQELLLHGRLDENHMRTGMRLARGVASDGEKRALLVAVAPLYLQATLRRDLFDTIKTIASDGEHARVLAAVVEDDSSDRETLLLAARSAGLIASDGEKSRLLISLADHYRGNEEIRDAWFESVNSIASDGEKRSVLSAVIKQGGADRDTLTEALKSAGRIASDGEKARFLVESSDFYIEDGAVRRNFFTAVDGIASDGEKRRVLSAIYQRAHQNPATFKQILRSAKTLNSSGEKASILEEAAGPMPPDPGLLDEFFAACDSIPADGEHARVLLRAIERNGAAAPTLTRVVLSASRISSDGEKARVLAQVIRLRPQDAEVRAALRRAIDSVRSDGESRKLLSEFSEGGV